MASIAFRNSSRRLLRAYFSKLGWQANVIWRIAFFNQLQVYPSWLWTSDLFRASLNFSARPVFDYGVDGDFRLVQIRDGRRAETGFSMAYQAKSTVCWLERDG